MRQDVFENAEKIRKFRLNQPLSYASLDVLSLSLLSVADDTYYPVTAAFAAEILLSIQYNSEKNLILKHF